MNITLYFDKRNKKYGVATDATCKATCLYMVLRLFNALGRLHYDLPHNVEEIGGWMAKATKLLGDYDEDSSALAPVVDNESGGRARGLVDPHHVAYRLHHDTQHQQMTLTMGPDDKAAARWPAEQLAPEGLISE